MLKLFIVDDEPMMRKVLSECFEWTKHNIEVIGEADDGMSGLNAIRNLKPDIVLADVKMPKMNGIDMVNNLISDPLFANTKVIFISGHDDLEYLKSALSISAIDYILKPVDFDELSRVLDKTAEIIKKENEQKSFINEMEIKLNQSIPLLKDKFFISLLSGAQSSEKAIQSKLEFLDLNLSLNGVFNVFVISIDDYECVFDNMKQKDIMLTSFAVLNITNELISNSFCGYAIDSGNCEFVCIVDLKDEADENKELLSDLLNKIKSYLQNILSLSVTIGVGKIEKSLSRIECSYEAAKEAAAKRFFYGTNKIIVHDQFEKGDDYQSNYDSKIFDKIKQVLKIGDYKKSEEYLEQIFKGMTETQSGVEEYCRNICLQLLTMTFWVLSDMGYSTADLGTDVNSLFQSISKIQTVYGMKENVMQHYKTVCTYISEKSNKNVSNIIKKIMSIIDKRYGENLTLADIANEVYFTSTYICIIFKQETGETINEYLTKVRIEQAKKMLANTEKKFYNISSEVGYTDPSYFSRLFKKYTGYSPSEYRDKV